MAGRSHHGDILQLRADLWRVPFLLCLAAVEALVKSDRRDVEAAYRRACSALGLP